MSHKVIPPSKGRFHRFVYGLKTKGLSHFSPANKAGTNISQAKDINLVTHHIYPLLPTEAPCLPRTKDVGDSLIPYFKVSFMHVNTSIPISLGHFRRFGACLQADSLSIAYGFPYGFNIALVVIIDVYSRYVLSWRLSNTQDADFCVEALKEALKKERPYIFNTNQGAQFTSEAFTSLLEQHGVRISMDGKGSYNDNLFIERLWRTVKYEEVYLEAYQDGRDAKVSLGEYFHFYNTERPHQSLGYRTPVKVFNSILVEATGGDMVESLILNPLRVAKPNLNIAPILS